MIVNETIINKLGVAYSGGAYLFPYHVGVINEMEERGIIPSFISGISAGTLVGVFQSMRKIDQLNELQTRLEEKGYLLTYTSEFVHEENGHFKIKMDGILKYLKIKLNAGTIFKVIFGGKDKILKNAADQLATLPGMADNTPLFKLLEEYVHLEDFQIPIQWGFVSLDTQEYVVVGPEDFDDVHECRKSIFASATMPGVWPVIQSIRLKNGKVYYNCADGGIRNNSGVMDVKEYVDKDETVNHLWGILAVNCSNDFARKRDGQMYAFDAIGRSFTTLMDETLSNDISAFTAVNNILDAIGHPVTVVKGDNRKTYRHYNFGLIEPFEDELGNSMNTNKEILRKRLEIGRLRARDYFESQIDVQ